jgi:hypothetical protein
LPTIRPVLSRGGVMIDVISVVAEHDTATVRVCHGVAGHDDVVAVTWPARADYYQAAPLSADDDLRS